MVVSSGSAVSGLLYSLIHLGGFAGDISFYRTRCGDAGRVVEFGCGDGRIAAALCLGESPLTVLQQQRQHEQTAPSATAAVGAAGRVEDPPAYVGIELNEELADKARERLGSAPGPVEIVSADFLAPLPEGLRSHFDAAIVSSNTLFCTGEHDRLLTRCAESLVPGGLLLLDVYNAMPWHEDDNEDDDEDALSADGALAEGGTTMDAASAGGAMASRDGVPPLNDHDLLVVVEDESGREWSVYEREVDVNADTQHIVCHYDFVGGGEDATPTAAISEAVHHYYLTPEQLVYRLDEAGFAIEAICGGFDGEPFDPQESEHVCVVARRQPATTTEG